MVIYQGCLLFSMLLILLFTLFAFLRSLCFTLFKPLKQHHGAEKMCKNFARRKSGMENIYRLRLVVCCECWPMIHLRSGHNGWFFKFISEIALEFTFEVKHLLIFCINWNSFFQIIKNRFDFCRINCFARIGD